MTRIELSPIRTRLSRRSRSAYTLLELTLALGLAVLVLSAVGTAIHVQLLTLTRQQSYIEQQQIARSVLTMISNDLRGALQYKAADVSGLEDLAVSQALVAGLLGGSGGSTTETGTGDGESGGDGGTGGGSQDDTGNGGTGGNGSTGGTGGTGGGGNEGNGGTGATNGQSGGQSTGESTGESTGTSEDTAAYRPLMIGSANQLLVDVSRLPRLDQYNSFMTGSDPQSQTPSDIKSISYFISQAPSPLKSLEFDSTVSDLGGLYRRQIDRAVADYRGEEEAPTSPDEFCKLVAPEVIEIKFRYYDGSDWVNEWDSLEQGYFPIAIEVLLTIDPNRVAQAGQENQRSTATDPLSDARQYRMVVHLPAAEAPPEEEAAQ